MSEVPAPSPITLEDILQAIRDMPTADRPETAKEVELRTSNVIAEAIRRAEAKRREDERARQMNGNGGWLNGLKLETSNLITLGGMAVTMALAFYAWSGEQAVVRRELAEHRKWVLEYTPKIIALEQANALQNQRMQNIVESVAEVRKQNNEMMLKLITMSENMATLTAKMGPRP